MIKTYRKLELAMFVQARSLLAVVGARLFEREGGFNLLPNLKRGSQVVDVKELNMLLVYEVQRVRLGTESFHSVPLSKGRVESVELLLDLQTILVGRVLFEDF